MSKHTPGPWSYCGCGKCQLVWGGDRETLVHMEPQDEEGATIPTDQEGIANARLIAAAPELLELLKEHLADNPEGDSDYCDCQLCEKTRAIIAKAEGRDGSA